MKNNSILQFMIITTLLVLYTSFACSQSKKQIKDLKIKTITETTTIHKGKTNSYKSSFTSYNKKGKQTSKIEYNSDGSFIKKETAIYDSDGNKTEERIYETLDTPKKDIKIISKFDKKGNKTEDIEYDGDGKFIRKQQFIYDSFNAKKQELTYDASGKIIRKVLYTYDNDRLRKSRNEFNEKNELVSEKKYQYTF